MIFKHHGLLWNFIASKIPRLLYSAQMLFLFKKIFQTIFKFNKKKQWESATKFYPLSDNSDLPPCIHPKILIVDDDMFNILALQ